MSNTNRFEKLRNIQSFASLIKPLGVFLEKFYEEFLNDCHKKMDSIMLSDSTDFSSEATIREIESLSVDMKLFKRLKDFYYKSINDGKVATDELNTNSFFQGE